MWKHFFRAVSYAVPARPHCYSQCSCANTDLHALSLSTVYRLPTFACTKGRALLTIHISAPMRQGVLPPNSNINCIIYQTLWHIHEVSMDVYGGHTSPGKQNDPSSLRNSPWLLWSVEFAADCASCKDKKKTRWRRKPIESLQLKEE